MTESSKTIAILVAAFAVLITGIVTRPRPPAPSTTTMVGKQLFPKLDDVSKPKRIKITTYNDGAGAVREFEVANVGGGWALPSHQNYPADAKDQMAEAATALSGLKVLGEVSDNPEDHELYGVLEPDKTKDQIGQKGIGKLVEMEDDAKNSLARLIIGKEDKSRAADDFGNTQAKLRFVRVKGQDRVYRVAMSSDKFSTQFDNWIETDLLKLSPWDIAQVELRDISATLIPTAEGLAPSVQRVSDVDLAFNDKDQKWLLEKFTKYVNRKPVEEKLKDGEELNTTKLNEMKTALDNLKIVDVKRKPEQMIADLKAQTEFVRDDQSASNLALKGFVPAVVNDKIEIFPSSGEAIVGMKDGVEYVLRFGNNAGVETKGDGEEESGDSKKSDSEKNDAKTAGKDEDKGDSEPDTLKVTEKKDANVNRYVMVTARFNADLLAKPELEPLPEIKKAPEKKDDAKAEPAKKNDAKGAAAKADEKKPDDAAAKTDEPEEDQDALEQRREKIEKENKRKQEEYDEKVKKGEEHAKELNSRFADWYYVISDDTFRKIHLGASDIIKPKPTEEKEGEPTAITPNDPFKNRGLPGAGKAAPAPAPAGKK